MRFKSVSYDKLNLQIPNPWVKRAHCTFFSERRDKIGINYYSHIKRHQNINDNSSTNRYVTRKYV